MKSPSALRSVSEMSMRTVGPYIDGSKDGGTSTFLTPSSSHGAVSNESSQEARVETLEKDLVRIRKEKDRLWETWVKDKDYLKRRCNDMEAKLSTCESEKADLREQLDHCQKELMDVQGVHAKCVSREDVMVRDYALAVQKFKASEGRESRLKSSVESLRSSNNELTLQLEKLKQSLTNTEMEVQRVEGECRALRQENFEQKTLKRENEEVLLLEREVEILKSALDTNREELRSRVELERSAEERLEGTVHEQVEINETLQSAYQEFGINVSHIEQSPSKKLEDLVGLFSSTKSNMAQQVEQLLEMLSSSRSEKQDLEAQYNQLMTEYSDLQRQLRDTANAQQHSTSEHDAEPRDDAVVEQMKQQISELEEKLTEAQEAIHQQKQSANATTTAAVASSSQDAQRDQETMFELLELEYALWNLYATVEQRPPVSPVDYSPKGAKPEVRVDDGVEIATGEAANAKGKETTSVAVAELEELRVELFTTRRELANLKSTNEDLARQLETESRKTKVETWVEVDINSAQKPSSNWGEPAEVGSDGVDWKGFEEDLAVGDSFAADSDDLEAIPLTEELQDVPSPPTGNHDDSTTSSEGGSGSDLDHSDTTTDSSEGDGNSEVAPSKEDEADGKNRVDARGGDPELENAAPTMKKEPETSGDRPKSDSLLADELTRRVLRERGGSDSSSMTFGGGNNAAGDGGEASSTERRLREVESIVRRVEEVYSVHVREDADLVERVCDALKLLNSRLDSIDETRRGPETTEEGEEEEEVGEIPSLSVATVAGKTNHLSLAREQLQHMQNELRMLRFSQEDLRTQALGDQDWIKTTMRTVSAHLFSLFSSVEGVEKKNKKKNRMKKLGQFFKV